MPIVGIYDLSETIAFLFSHWSQYFLTSLLVFSGSNILIVLIPSYPFFLLNCAIKLSLLWGRVLHKEIMKRWILENNPFGQHDHTVEFNLFRFCVSLYSCLFCYFVSTFMIFLHSLQIIHIFETDKKNFLYLSLVTW